MSTTKEPTQSILRKLQPRVKAPEPELLASLSAEQREVLRRLLKETAECMYHSVYEDPDAEARFGRLPTEGRSQSVGSSACEDSGDFALVSMDGETLPIDDERYLFLHINYARWRVLQMLSEHRGRNLSTEAACTLLKWEDTVTAARNEIVRVNMPLVLAMVKRTKIANVDYADLISEGNLALLRSVDKFDCSRGFKFSTYACRAILKAFARVATRTARYRGHFPTEFDPALEKSDFVEKRRHSHENDCASELRSLFESNVARLNDVERQVIQHRFALGTPEDDGKTLEQVGMMIGVTKERVRQIQNKALSKLRAMMEEAVLTA